ncbi:MAG: hypothetical protein CMP81_09820 [Fulvimarina sp.]|nr:hypothetical protein [Fulvimarina sp.]
MSAPSTNLSLKLAWQRTWPGEPTEDYVAMWEGTEVARFYRYDVSSERKGQWLWTVFAYHRSPTAESGPAGGFVSGSAREAAHVVEEAFERARAVWGIPDVVRFAAPAHH